MYLHGKFIALKQADAIIVVVVSYTAYLTYHAHETELKDHCHDEFAVFSVNQNFANI